MPDRSRATAALLSAALLAASALGGAALGDTTAPTRGYFASIDGLQPELLEALTAARLLDAPAGLGRLYRSSVVVERAWPIVTTLTAPSHLSTITCSPPSRHGIVANGFITGGKKVSGFSYPAATEPLWLAAKRQGKRVLSLAYAGADGSTPDRTPDFGIGYPDDALLGPSQTLDWTLSELPAAQGWRAGATGVDAAAAREATVTIVLNPKTGERRTVHALVAPAADGAPAAVWLDTDKDLGNGHLGRLGGGEPLTRTVDAFFIEDDQASTLRGSKRRTFFRLLPADAGRISLYLSKASYNNAFPASFRAQLDAASLVWPDYGVRSSKLSLAEYVESQAMIDRFLAELGRKYAPALGADVVLFYQPLIDSLGHKMQAALPQPFDPRATDEVTQAYVQAFKIVDRNVSRLRGDDARGDVVALMGDHGMDAIRKTVNLARLLPADHIGKVEIVASGSLTLLYAPVDATGDEARIEEARAIGAALKARLEATRDGDAAVAGQAFARADFLPARIGQAGAGYEREWAYGEALWAFTSASGYWYQYTPLDQGLFGAPPALGMHGHALDVPTMATTMLFKARDLPARRIPDGSLIDAVPTFGKLMGIEPPAQCLGRSLL